MSINSTKGLPIVRVPTSSTATIRTANVLPRQDQTLTGVTLTRVGGPVGNPVLTREGTEAQTRTGIKLSPAEVGHEDPTIFMGLLEGGDLTVAMADTTAVDLPAIGLQASGMVFVADGEYIDPASLGENPTDIDGLKTDIVVSAGEQTAFLDGDAIRSVVLASAPISFLEAGRTQEVEVLSRGDEVIFFVFDEQAQEEVYGRVCDAVFCRGNRVKEPADFCAQVTAANGEVLTIRVEVDSSLFEKTGIYQLEERGSKGSAMSGTFEFAEYLSNLMPGGVVIEGCNQKGEIFCLAKDEESRDRLFQELSRAADEMRESEKGTPVLWRVSEPISYEEDSPGGGEATVHAVKVELTDGSVFHVKAKLSSALPMAAQAAMDQESEIIDEVMHKVMARDEFRILPLSDQQEIKNRLHDKLREQAILQSQDPQNDEMTRTIGGELISRKRVVSLKLKRYADEWFREWIALKKRQKQPGRTSDTRS
jgi:hypothetical protein